MKVIPKTAIGILDKQKTWSYKVVNGAVHSNVHWRRDLAFEVCDVHYLHRDRVKVNSLRSNTTSTSVVLSNRGGDLYEMAPKAAFEFTKMLTNVTDIPFSIDREGYVDIYFVIVKRGSSMIGIEVVDPSKIKHKVL